MFCELSLCSRICIAAAHYLMEYTAVMLKFGLGIGDRSKNARHRCEGPQLNSVKNAVCIYTPRRRFQRLPRFMLNVLTVLHSDELCLV